MTEPTMEEYMTKTLEAYGSGIAREKFDKDAKCELKGQFLKELRDNTFSGSINKDANEHIERVLEIFDLFTTPDVTQDQLMFREVVLFYKGLDVPTRQILDSKGGVPKMEADDAKKAIQEMADYSQKCHYGTSSRNKNSNTSDGLVAIQAQLNNLDREIKKTVEDAYYTQFGVPFLNPGMYRAAALGFYQRDNGNPSYHERRQTMEESLRSGSLSSSTEINPRDHGKSISTAEEAQPSQCSFPSRLKEYGYDEKEVLKGLKKLQVNLAESATSLKILLKEKTKIKVEIKATMNEHYSVIIKDDLPPKEKNPGSFTLPCKINNMCFDKALADLEASVSVMPYSTFTNLGLGLTIKEGEVIDEPMVDVVKLSFYNSIMKDKIEYKGKNIVGAFINVPIFIGNFSAVTGFAVVENMDAYHDKYMRDVIFGKPFCRVTVVKARRNDGFITIGDGNDCVTYQMA
ncbi:hypothetical protein Tco_1001528 [Tanacetum coccineum]